MIYARGVEVGFENLGEGGHFNALCFASRCVHDTLTRAIEITLKLLLKETPVEKSSLIRMLSRGALVADGATGSNLQARGLIGGQAPEEWVFEKPAEIVQLHREFITAGAEIILTCTFGGTRARLGFSGLANKVKEVNQEAVQLARKAVAIEGRDVLIAGSMGPAGFLVEPNGHLTETECKDAYAEQAHALIEAGVDLLVIETQFDIREAVLAVEGVRMAKPVPIAVSFSYDMGTRTMMGVRPRDATRTFVSMGVDIIGVNCGKSLESNISNLKETRAETSLPVWMKPNAGLPRMVSLTESVWDVTPEEMGTCAQSWLDLGANICGGCCGTTPQHLSHIARAVKSRRNE